MFLINIRSPQFFQLADFSEQARLFQGFGVVSLKKKSGSLTITIISVFTTLSVGQSVTQCWVNREQAVSWSVHEYSELVTSSTQLPEDMYVPGTKEGPSKSYLRTLTVCLWAATSCGKWQETEAASPSTTVDVSQNVWLPPVPTSPLLWWQAYNTESR